MTAPRAPGPLQGVRVLEVGNFLAAPFCTMQLADLGAQVIKIENPDGGDFSRQFEPRIGQESAGFMQVNRNKQSLALNLKTDEGKGIFVSLVAESDIVVENLRPGVMKALGLDYSALRTDHPQLIYFAASGWGQDGVAADRPGLDIMAQAYSGIMSVTGEEDGEPVKVGVPICDLTCALYGTIGILSALHHKSMTGEGQFVDVSLLESGVALSVWDSARFFATGEIPRARGTAHQSSAPYQAIRTKDGFVTVGAATEHTWVRLCETLSRTDLMTDERFDTHAGRFANRKELIVELEAVMTDEDTAHWVTELQRTGVPVAPIQNYAQVFSDEVVLRRGFVVDQEHPNAGPIRVVASPIRLSQTPASVVDPAPTLGQHSSQVLARLGLSEDEISALVAQGVVSR